MKYDVEELVKLYDRVVEYTVQLGLPAKKQIEKLKGTDVTYEIASDFGDSAVPYGKILFENDWMNKEQFELMLKIDHMLDEMGNNKKNWTDEALMHSEEWDKCRLMGNKLLETLGVNK